MYTHIYYTYVYIHIHIYNIYTYIHVYIYIYTYLQGLSQNKVEMDSKLLNTIMGAYLKCQRPKLTIEVFNNFTLQGAFR